MASATSEFQTGNDHPLADSSSARAFHLVVTVLTVAGLGTMIVRDSVPIDVPDLAAWILASLLADLMCVRIGKSITLSMSLPVLLAAGFLHSPDVTALIAFLGCLDPRELQGKISLERILFNRSQISMAAGVASLAMHTLPHVGVAWPWVIAVFGVGLLADCLVNVAFVAVSTALSGRASLTEAIAGLWGPEPAASFALYASMCLVAPLFLLVYRDWGPWALLACTSLLLPFRLALSRIESLDRVAQAARVREAALADAEASASVQRREERLLLAGDLHDEVLPALFKVHLMGEVLRQDLASGRLLDLDEDLPDLLGATRAALQAGRRMVGDLRTTRSAIRNVARAIRSSAEQVEKEGTPRIDLRLAEIHVSERAGRVLLQVAREAMVNASRYSGASRIRVQLEERPSGLAELTIADDGIGFDVSAVDGAYHFGLQLMRERVEAVGGQLDIVSSEGLGTVVSARLPRHGRTPPTKQPPRRTEGAE